MCVYIFYSVPNQSSYFIYLLAYYTAVFGMSFVFVNMEWSLLLVKILRDNRTNVLYTFLKPSS